MPIVKFNVASHEPVGSTVSVFGNDCEVREDGVYGTISDEFVDLYKSAGRILEVVKPVEVTAEQVKEVEQSAAVVVEQGSGKRGRPAKSAE